MERRRLLAAGAATGIAAGIVSSPGYANDGNGEIDRDIVGSWFGTVTATNPPLGSFNDLISFHVGGVVMEFAPLFDPEHTFRQSARDHRSRSMEANGKIQF